MNKVYLSEPRQPRVWKTNHDSRMETETLTVFESRVPTKDSVGLFRMQCGEDNESMARQLKRKKYGEQFRWGFFVSPVCPYLHGTSRVKHTLDGGIERSVLRGLAK